MSKSFVHAGDETFDGTIDSVTVIQELVQGLCGFLFIWPADIEIEERAEVVKESILAAKHYFIITFATLNHEAFVNFNSHLFLHFVPHALQSSLVDDLDVELTKLSMRIVWVRVVANCVTYLWFVVVDFLVSLTEEVIKSVSLDGWSTSHRFRNIVTQTAGVRLVWLTVGLPGEVEATSLNVSMGSRLHPDLIVPHIQSLTLWSLGLRLLNWNRVLLGSFLVTDSTEI